MVVERATRMPFTAAEVGAWHARPLASERLMPPWARGRDPFRHWTHVTSLEPDGGGCIVRDRIEWNPSGVARFAPVAGRMRRRALALLAYRHATAQGDLEANQGHAPRTIAVSGATGFVGQALVAYLSAGGHSVVQLVRGGRTATPGAVRSCAWDPDRGTIDAAALEGVDAVIHLAGANIAGARWTRARKQLLLESRVRGTALLARTIAGLSRRPGALVSVSGVGIYGDRGDEVLEDAAPPGSGFLPDLARAWEAAADPARAAGIRTVHPRLGLVLSPAGGALARLLPPFRLGLGGPIGSGQQWMASASMDDVLGILAWSALDDAVEGPVNAVMPDVVRNAEFGRTLGLALHRPAVLPVPAFALRVALGELADAALLSSQRAVPSQLMRAAYRYRHPTLLQALQHVLGTWPPHEARSR